MDPRQQKALVIADKFRISAQDSCRWSGPSQYGTGKYAVTILGQNSHCTCPDYEKRQQPCKHVLAVEIYRVQQEDPDGSQTVTESVTVIKRTTYKQDWPAYNAAQTRMRKTRSRCCSGASVAA